MKIFFKMRMILLVGLFISGLKAGAEMEKSNPFKTYHRQIWNLERQISNLGRSKKDKKKRFQLMRLLDLKEKAMERALRKRIEPLEKKIERREKQLESCKEIHKKNIQNEIEKLEKKVEQLDILANSFGPDEEDM